MMFLKGRRLFKGGNFDGLRVNILRRMAGFFGGLKMNNKIYKSAIKY